MKFVLYLLVALAFASWVVALFSGIRMFGMLSGRLSSGAMLLRGIEWFNAENFKPEAAGTRLMFIRAFVAFFICVLAIAIIAMLSARPA